MSNFPRLEKLWAGSCGLAIEPDGHIARGLEADAKMAALMSVLPQTRIKELHLDDNDSFGPASAAALAVALPHMPFLEELHLSGLRNFGDAGMHALAPQLPAGRSLWFLYIPAGNFGDDGVRALIAVLPRCRALRHLCIGTRDDEDTHRMFGGIQDN